MNEVTVTISTETATGRRLLNEIAKHPKHAHIDNPLPPGPYYTIDEAFDEIMKLFNAHYGTNYKL